MTGRVVTVAELAAALGLELAEVARLLLVEERRGAVERAAGGWRLTAAFEERHGRQLRELEADR